MPVLQRLARSLPSIGPANVTNRLQCRRLMWPPSTVQKGPKARTVEAARFYATTAWVDANSLVKPPGKQLTVTFVDQHNQEHKVSAVEGDNLLTLAKAHNLDLEGACGGECACSTCHVIVMDPEVYKSMEEPAENECDMLDLAHGLTETSRLGCQLQMLPEKNGLRVKLPNTTIGQPSAAAVRPLLKTTTDSPMESAVAEMA